MNRAAVIILMGTSVACGGDKDDDSVLGSACERALSSWSETTESDDDAIATIQIDNPGDLRSVHVSATSADDRTLLMLYEIEAPNGDIQLQADDWWSSSEILSMAPFPYNGTSNANWPVLPELSGPLTEGTWTFRFKTLSPINYSDDREEPVEFWVHENANQEERRCLHVQFVWADGVQDNEQLVADVEKAVHVFEGIWLRHNVTVHSSWIESDIDPVLPSPGSGSAEISELVAEGPDDTLTIIIGETMEIASEGLAGESGGIPGALHPTEHSAVVVAWLELAGVSGSLEDDEVQMLGETIAHEVGHYTGLVHPVQSDADLDVVAWDAVPDTVNCQDVDACLEQLASNMMFPYLLCDWTSYCDAQDEITDQQAAVLRTFAGTR